MQVAEMPMVGILSGGGVAQTRERRLWWFGHVMRPGGEGKEELVRTVQGWRVESRRGRGRYLFTWEQGVRRDMAACEVDGSRGVEKRNVASPPGPSTVFLRLSNRRDGRLSVAHCDVT